MKYDVVVIGSGMSGLIAAAKAVSLQKSTLVITRGQGVLPLTTGCIDLWGYQSDNPGVAASDPFAEISKAAAVSPEHPYAIVAGIIGESVNFFKEIMESVDYSYNGNIHKNHKILTALGSERISALVPQSMVIQEPEKVKTIIAVGFKNYPDFYPQMFLDNLSKASFPEAERIPLLVDLGISETVRSTHLSILLEHQDVFRKITDQLTRLLLENNINFTKCQDDSLLFAFPAVLGRNPDYAIWKRMSEFLHAQVLEVPGLPPSVPGQRLNKALNMYLRKRGTEFYYNSEVTGYNTENGKITSVLVKDSSRSTRTIEAGSVILATGSFIGGGLQAKKDCVMEPIFKLPVLKSGHQGDEAHFLSLQGQTFLQAGLEVDDQLRPHYGYENLYAAGSILAHSNYASEKSGLGIALATGYKAGCLA